MKKWVLYACDSDGRAFGMLGKNREVITDQAQMTKENVMLFNKKADTSELVMQINLGHMLLPNGVPYRVCPVREEV